jgi:plastocyanin
VNTTRNSIRSVVALGAGIALTLAACGGDDDAATPTTTPSMAPADSAETALPPSPVTSDAPGSDGTDIGDDDDTRDDETQDDDTRDDDTRDDDTRDDDNRDDAAPDDGAVADGDTITIADFSFSGVTEVAVGTTVVVMNTDAAPHTWSAQDGTFDSGAIAPGETFEFTFTDAGEFAYFCNFHPSMTGTIVVTA